jgi:hypothetical protein
LADDLWFSDAAWSPDMQGHTLANQRMKRFIELGGFHGLSLGSGWGGSGLKGIGTNVRRPKGGTVYNRICGPEAEPQYLSKNSGEVGAATNCVRVAAHLESVYALLVSNENRLQEIWSTICNLIDRNDPSWRDIVVEDQAAIVLQLSYLEIRIGQSIRPHLDDFPHQIWTLLRIWSVPIWIRRSQRLFSGNRKLYKDRRPKSREKFHSIVTK